MLDKSISFYLYFFIYLVYHVTIHYLSPFLPSYTLTQNIELALPPTYLPS